MLEVDGDVGWEEGRFAPGRRVSLWFWVADRREGVGCGEAESDSAEARLNSVNESVCQLIVPLLIQNNPVTNAATILKRLLRVSELLCECHMLLASPFIPGQPHKNAHPKSRMGVP